MNEEERELIKLFQKTQAEQKQSYQDDERIRKARRTLYLAQNRRKPTTSDTFLEQLATRLDSNTIVTYLEKQLKPEIEAHRDALLCLAPGLFVLYSSDELHFLLFPEALVGSDYVVDIIPGAWQEELTNKIVDFASFFTQLLPLIRLRVYQSVLYRKFTAQESLAQWSALNSFSTSGTSLPPSDVQTLLPRIVECGQDLTDLCYGYEATVTVQGVQGYHPGATPPKHASNSSSSGSHSLLDSEPKKPGFFEGIALKHREADESRKYGVETDLPFWDRHIPEYKPFTTTEMQLFRVDLDIQSWSGEHKGRVNAKSTTLLNGLELLDALMRDEYAKQRADLLTLAQRLDHKVSGHIRRARLIPNSYDPRDRTPMYLQSYTDTAEGTVPIARESVAVRQGSMLWMFYVQYTYLFGTEAQLLDTNTMTRPLLPRSKTRPQSDFDAEDLKYPVAKRIFHLDMDFHAERTEASRLFKRKAQERIELFRTHVRCIAASIRADRMKYLDNKYGSQLALYEKQREEAILIALKAADTKRAETIAMAQINYEKDKDSAREQAKSDERARRQALLGSGGPNDGLYGEISEDGITAQDVNLSLARSEMTSEKKAEQLRGFLSLRFST